MSVKFVVVRFIFSLKFIIRFFDGLEIISVYFRRNKRLIFDNFNLKLRKSQIIILIGDNGVGKSSLLDIAAGILRPEKGTIKINKKPLNELGSDKKENLLTFPTKIL